MFKKEALVVACMLAVQVSSQPLGKPFTLVKREIGFPMAEFLDLQKRGAGMPRPDSDSRLMKRHEEVPHLERLLLLKRRTPRLETDSGIMRRHSGPPSVGMIPKRSMWMDIHGLETRDASTPSPQPEFGVMQGQAGPSEMDASVMPGTEPPSHS
ncbi:uncharacterized protein LOC125038288 isoform X2 [Penaeus chinensis]|uniref:uncharacterized protein LOC125038288 isoform X2 n=1 Tax=Penaeus chinensis TaxID=139456 RepID=UPI001FB57CAD|nr:uncharacterized protein LOC125038288 isoform X2 [Penaeus chinensis]